MELEFDDSNSACNLLPSPCDNWQGSESPCYAFEGKILRLNKLNWFLDKVDNFCSILCAAIQIQVIFFNCFKFPLGELAPIYNDAKSRSWNKGLSQEENARYLDNSSVFYFYHVLHKILFLLLPSCSFRRSSWGKWWVGLIARLRRLTRKTRERWKKEQEKWAEKSSLSQWVCLCVSQPARQLKASQGFFFCLKGYRPSRRRRKKIGRERKKETEEENNRRSWNCRQIPLITVNPTQRGQQQQPCIGERKMEEQKKEERGNRN